MVLTTRTAQRSIVLATTRKEGGYMKTYLSPKLVALMTPQIREQVKGRLLSPKCIVSFTCPANYSGGGVECPKDYTHCILWYFGN